MQYSCEGTSENLGRGRQQTVAVYPQNTLESVVKSVQKYSVRMQHFGFWQVPPEHRVIVPLNDVLAKTGMYYVRCFGHGEWTEAQKMKVHNEIKT